MFSSFRRKKYTLEIIFFHSSLQPERSDTQYNGTTLPRPRPSPLPVSPIPKTHSLSPVSLPLLSPSPPPVPPPLLSELPIQGENMQSTPAPVPELDPELLLALEDASVKIPVYGPAIHDTLAQRWLPILKKGLQSDKRKSFLKPMRCRIIVSC